MTIKIESHKDKTSLSIDGELTIYTAHEYKQSIINGFTADKLLELDMSGVEEIDTSGLQLLAAMDKQLVDCGSEMKIISASDVVKDAIYISALLPNFKCDEEGGQS